MSNIPKMGHLTTPVITNDSSEVTMPPGHIGGTHHQHTHQVVAGHVADQVTELFEEFPEQRPTRPLKHTMDLQTYIITVYMYMHVYTYIYIYIYIYMLHMAYMYVYI